MTGNRRKPVANEKKTARKNLIIEIDKMKINENKMEDKKLLGKP